MTYWYISFSNQLLNQFVTFLKDSFEILDFSLGFFWLYDQAVLRLEVTTMMLDYGFSFHLYDDLVGVWRWRF